MKNFLKASFLLAGIVLTLSAANAQTTAASSRPSKAAPAAPGPVHAESLSKQGRKMVTGLLVENESGTVIKATNPDVLFNPASTLKLATALMALRTWGPAYNFPTRVFISGKLDKNGTLHGDLLVSGHDPIFRTEQAEELRQSLNEHGVKIVTGNLYVCDSFTLNLYWSGHQALSQLKEVLNPDAAASAEDQSDAPNVRVKGKAGIMLVQPGSAPPAGFSELFVQTHATLPEVLKVMLCYSSNIMAKELGDNLGGPSAVQKFVEQELSLSSGELFMSSTSGLGINAISPRTMVKMLRALLAELKSDKLELSDILAVGGIDRGTLELRFGANSGTVIAKTGTLTDTSHGVVNLAGAMNTKNDGVLLFVMFEQCIENGATHAHLQALRQKQDIDVARIQSEHGGPAQFVYVPRPLVWYLAPSKRKPAVSK